MRKFLYALPLAVLLTACGTTPITADAVVSAIKQSCGIVVPVTDIAVLITQANPIATTIDGFVKAICDAFKAQQAAAAGTRSAEPVKEGTVTVNGVEVHWHI